MTCQHNSSRSPAGRSTKIFVQVPGSNTLPDKGECNGDVASLNCNRGCLKIVDRFRSPIGQAHLLSDASVETCVPLLPIFPVSGGVPGTSVTLCHRRCSCRVFGQPKRMSPLFARKGGSNRSPQIFANPQSPFRAAETKQNSKLHDAITSCYYPLVSRGEHFQVGGKGNFSHDRSMEFRTHVVVFGANVAVE